MEPLIRFAADGLLVIIVLAGGVAIVRGVSRHAMIERYPYMIMAGLTALLVAKAMSLIYQPAVARPFIQLGLQPGAEYIDNPGFPSDHALLASVVVFAVYVMTPYKKLALLLAALIVAMGVGRVLALVHTPLDVVGGIAAAVIGAAWYLSIPRYSK